MTDPEDPKDPKKSESLEVRVPWRLKQEFMARARREGRSASEVVRDLMQDYVSRPAQRTATQTLETAMTAIRKRPAPAFAAIVGAAGISAVLAGAIPAGAAPDLRAEFRTLDANGDGAVTTEELNGGFRVDPLIVHSQQPPVEEHGNAVMMRVLLVPGSGEPGERRILIEQPAGAGGEPADWSAHLIAAFAAGDTDGDGQLSLQEYVARDQWARDMSFASLDVNEDGAIDASETIAVDVHHDPAADAAIAAAASPATSTTRRCNAAVTGLSDRSSGKGRGHTKIVVCPRLLASLQPWRRAVWRRTDRHAGADIETGPVGQEERDREVPGPLGPETGFHGEGAAGRPLRQRHLPGGDGGLFAAAGAANCNPHAGDRHDRHP